MITKLPFVPDWSVYVTIPDMSKVTPRPRLAITKATEGNYTQDANFIKFWQAFRTNGIPRGAYHFWAANISGLAQANYFIKFIQQGGVHDDDLLIVDLEVAGINASELIIFLNTVEAVFPNNVIIFYSRKNILDSIARTLAQAARLKQYSLWLAWYPLFPDTVSWITGANIPAGWGQVVGWQYSDNGAITGVTGKTDMNVFTADFLALFPQAPIPPATDITTQPRPGMTRVSGFRNGWKFELFISDPSQINFEVVCVNGLDTVSNITKSHNAVLGVNGGEWDRISAPKDYTVSNGKVCHPRVEAVPSLLIFDLENKVLIDHQNSNLTIGHAISGLRYLIQNGVIQSYLDGTEPQYTEGHARSIHGITSAGFHMVMQSEGMYPNQGLTLKQAAEIMKQYGAVKAFDSGGGGDVACSLDGLSLIIPENIDPASGQHFERPLPVVFLAYAKDKTMNGIAKENLGKIPTIRSSPSVVTGNDVLKGAAFMVVGFTGEPVPDLNPASTIKWLHLTDGNYVNYTDASHTGAMAYFVITQQPTVDPPPVPVSDKMVISITQNGVTKTYTSNGTITVS